MIRNDLLIIVENLRLVHEHEKALLPDERNKLRDYAGSCMAIRDQLAALIQGTANDTVSGTQLGDGNSAA